MWSAWPPGTSCLEQAFLRGLGAPQGQRLDDHQPQAARKKGRQRRWHEVTDLSNSPSRLMRATR
jgi:hypothetical protein